jgi:hypothetical protein
VLQLKLDRKSLTHLTVVLTALNILFITGMAVFVSLWERRDSYGPSGRYLIERVLVQFHLGTENVVAAWYSSMLLLLVTLACLVAYVLDTQALTPSEAQKGDRSLFRTVAKPAIKGTVPFFRYGWVILAATFAALSLDEIGSLHERVGMVVALNRASLAPSSTHPVGWVYMLAIPIALVAMSMLAFGWIRMRRAPYAFALLATGVLLYVCDPVLEAVEGSLVRHGGGILLLLERILEEGVAELGGTTCLLLGVLLYSRRVAGDGPHVFTAPHPTVIAAGAAALTAGPTIVSEIVFRLPPGDTGIPENWFPAAALFLLAATAYTTFRGRIIALLALVASAYFGAGFLPYAAWFKAIGYRGVLVDTIITAITVTLLGHWMSALTTQRRAASPTP